MVSGPLPHIRRGRMTPEDRQEIERLASTMLKPSPGVIAQKINRHPATVNWYMLTHGLVERKVGRAPRPYQRNGKTVHPYAIEHDRFILNLRIQGNGPTEIAKLLTDKFGIQRSLHSVQIRLVQLAVDPDI